MLAAACVEASCVEVPGAMPEERLDQRGSLSDWLVGGWLVGPWLVGSWLVGAVEAADLASRLTRGANPDAGEATGVGAFASLLDDAIRDGSAACTGTMISPRRSRSRSACMMPCFGGFDGGFTGWPRERRD